MNIEPQSSGDKFVYYRKNTGDSHGRGRKRWWFAMRQTGAVVSWHNRLDDLWACIHLTLFKQPCMDFDALVRLINFWFGLTSQRQFGTSEQRNLKKLCRLNWEFEIKHYRFQIDTIRYGASSTISQVVRTDPVWDMDHHSFCLKPTLLCASTK